MNIQQLQYIVAVERYRQFSLAAEACYVTQPTLSMMIRKLEEELDVKIFDRTRQPVIPTIIGHQIINQARIILKETAHLEEIVKQYNGDISGELRVGVIPTVAPYILPEIIMGLMTRYPGIQLHVSEMITEKIISELRYGHIDAGIVATLSEEPSLTEILLYKEKFYAYVSSDDKLSAKKYILPEEILPESLWLLEEGHCFRSQIQKLCELSKNSKIGNRFQYRFGNIETLVRMVDKNGGITIIPQLALCTLSDQQQLNIRDFNSPEPVREVYLVTSREKVKSKLIVAFQDEILGAIPANIKEMGEDSVFVL